MGGVGQLLPRDTRCEWIDQSVPVKERGLISRGHHNFLGPADSQWIDSEGTYMGHEARAGSEQPRLGVGYCRFLRGAAPQRLPSQLSVWVLATK